MIKWVRMGLQDGLTMVFANFHLRKFLKHPEKYTLKEQYEFIHRKLAKISKHAFRARFIVNGQENLPEGQVVFYSNHTSNYDPLAYLSYGGRIMSFVAKKEIADFPIIGNAVRCLRGTFIDRNDLRSEIKSFREMSETLKKNPELSFIVFPEGTRAQGPEYELGDFKPGAFHVATDSNLPIVPVAIYLPARVFDQNYHYHRYPIQITYGKPLFPEEYKDMTSHEIAEETKKRVDEMLTKEKELDLTYVKMLNHYSDKKAKKVQYTTKKEKKKS